MNNRKSRGWGIAVCIAFAGLMLLCGWLVPSHIKAIDASVVDRAGNSGMGLIDCGLTLLHNNNPTAAQLLLQAANNEKIPRAEELSSALSAHTQAQALFSGGPIDSGVPVTTFVLRLENRERVLAHLQSSASPAVKELLRSRNLTNTVLFSPSASSSGQAFDAAVAVTGLLLDGNHLSPGLMQALVERGALAQTRSDAQPLEEILMDILSLGQRLDWGQLAEFTVNIYNPATLSLLANQIRNSGSQLPELYSAVVLSDQPDQVATYLNAFSKSGITDISVSLRHGKGGMIALLQSHRRLYDSSVRRTLVNTGPFAPFFRASSDYALRAPWFAQMVKWLFYIAGGFLIAAAFHRGWPPVTELRQPPSVPQFRFVRDLLFSLGFLLVVLLLSEPFLASENQKAEFAFRLRLPGAAAASTLPLDKSKHMQDNDPKNLLTLLLFFVLQAIIYSVCLAKLAEIKKQNVPARVQLKLLENEEHLFDAGLYIGFAGTIVCLILISMKFIQQQSLMAAYSSTSFGIIFVSVFKIFNLRPVRRRLLMQAEAQAMISDKPTPTTPAMAPTA